MRRLLTIGAVAAGAAAVGFYYGVRPWWKSWGVDPDETDMTLTGDDLVGQPTVTDTRGITIDAPPSAVWPWLVQMGYGRGGWYSYDQLDMKGSSADAIVPEWQSLDVGDTIPTFPGGGFLVKAIEPEKALVLFLDNEMVAAARTAQASTAPESGGAKDMPGLAFAGAMGGQAMPGAFAVTWAFVLVPREDGRTRLVERFRVHLDTETPSSRLGQPLLGFGVFVMTQRQMVGIRDRAEKLARERGVPAVASEVAPEPDIEAGPAAGKSAIPAGRSA